jgi:transposase
MGESMTRTKLRAYTPEFHAEAVKLVLEQGLSLEAAAERLTVPKGVDLYVVSTHFFTF